MRKALIITVLALLLVGVLAPAAVAGKPAATETYPLDYWVPTVNPCTGGESWHHITGVQQVTEEAGHILVKWIGPIASSDGYAMPARHWARQVVNIKETADSIHFALTETDTVMLTNPDGGKMRLRYRVHGTIDDGVFRSGFEVFDLACIQHP